MSRAHGPAPSLAARLVPAIYSGAPAIAIASPRTSPKDEDQSTPDAAAAAAAADALRAHLALHGCELLRIDGGNSSDLQHARPDTHRVAFVVYNKAYDADEMANQVGHMTREEGTTAAHQPQHQFHSGHDLNSFFSLGAELVWRYFDHRVSLDARLHPNLMFFVDLAQLDQAVYERYAEYANRQMAMEESSRLT